MKVVYDFDGLMHEGQDPEAARKQISGDIDGLAFVSVWEIVQEKVNFFFSGADHDGVQFARNRIAALHAAGVALLDE